MSATTPLLKPAGEPAGRQRSGLNRYAVHLGLVAATLAVLLVGRIQPRWESVQLGLPLAQSQAAVATVAPRAEEGALPTPAPAATLAPEAMIRRGAIPHTYEPDLPVHEFATHVVEKGETPNGVAELYGITPATLLFGNPDLSNEAQRFQIGITLTILPTDGALHTVVASDTVESIAEMYGVGPQVVIDYGDNHLEKWPHRPVPGTELFIPGGEQQLLVWSYTPNTPRGTVSGSSYYDGPIVAAGRGSFVWPTDSWRITQYYWWAHRAIDIGAPVGTPVYASDGGTVIYAGWSAIGYGNLLVLDHGNGFQTYYAHLSSFWVGHGQFVGQGVPIAAVGNTGNSSGPHLHFEIRYIGNLLNPLEYLWE